MLADPSAPSGRSPKNRFGRSVSSLIARSGSATALFDLAIDCKLRGCDLVKLRIGDLVAGSEVRNRAMII